MSDYEQKDNTGVLFKNDKTYLEREPLENLCRKNQLSAFKHHGFWQCMDTKRDKDNLEEIIDSGKQIW